MDCWFWIISGMWMTIAGIAVASLTIAFRREVSRMEQMQRWCYGVDIDIRNTNK